MHVRISRAESVQSYILVVPPRSKKLTSLQTQAGLCLSLLAGSLCVFKEREQSSSLWPCQGPQTGQSLVGSGVHGSRSLPESQGCLLPIAFLSP